MKKNKKTNIKDRGITLIALIITIIVLLILAGVSIATLTGENGLLGKAEQAKVENEKAGERFNTISLPSSKNGRIPKYRFK